MVEVGVAVNAWYAPFYDLIQTALASPNKVSINQFYQEIGIFLGIALIAVVIGVLNNFFVNRYVFRWRTAMNEHYTEHRRRICVILKGPHSVCGKTYDAFCVYTWKIWHQLH